MPVRPANQRAKILKVWSLLYFITFFFGWVFLSALEKGPVSFLILLGGFILDWLAVLMLLDNLVELIQDFDIRNVGQIYGKLFGVTGIGNTGSLLVIGIALIALSFVIS